MSKPVVIVISIAVIFALTGGALYYLQNQKSRLSCGSMNPFPIVVAFGDSLVAGYGATTEGGFVSLLAKDAGIPIQNFGRNGETTAGALKRVEAVMKANPSVVILLIGGNDALQKVPQMTTERNLELLIERFQESGSSVILLGVLGSYPFSDPYAPMFKRLAEQYEVAYIPNVLSGIFGKADLMSDSIHPNEAGYQKIADKVRSILERECGKLGGSR